MRNLDEPVLKSIIIEVAIFDCGIDAHKHKTKSGAMRCIAARKTSVYVKYRIMNDGQEFPGLSVRAGRCLLAENIDSVSKLRAHISTHGSVRNIPNVGVSLEAEILKWIESV